MIKVPKAPLITCNIWNQIKVFLYEEDFLSPADIFGKSFGVFAYNRRLMIHMTISTVFDVRRSFKKSCALISSFKV